MREHRIAAGISQEHLAERARMSVESISALERGVRRKPRPDTIELLVNALALDETERAALSRAANAARARRASAPATATNAKNNLPSAITSFIGREREISDLRSLLLRGEDRVITLVGPGGVGKSRLASEAVRDVADAFRDGVWLVSLASVMAEEARVEVAIADVLEIPSSGGSIIEQIQRALEERSLLVILDNCEHVVEAVSSTVAAISVTCPAVRFIVTSRERLQAPGERVYALGPLAERAAAELFVRRAASIFEDNIAPSEQDADAVTDIVRRLDGLPLAIELAVPALRILTVRELASRIQQNLDVVVGIARTPLPHHRTLHALIGWSYHRLSAQERALFACCSTFAGRFTVDALLAVATIYGLTGATFFQTLSRLVETSLIAVEGREERIYRLLDTIRDFASHIHVDRADRNERSRAHAHYYLDVAERLFNENDSAPGNSRLLQLMKPHRAECEQVLQWALVDAHDPVTGAALVSAMFVLWTAESYDRCRMWLERALAAIDVETSPLLWARLTLSLAQTVQFQYKTLPILDLEQAISIIRNEGDAHLLCRGLGWLAMRYNAESNSKLAVAAAEESILVGRASLPKADLAWSYLILANVLLRQGPRGRLKAVLDECLEYCPPSGEGVGLVLSYLGEYEFEEGRLDAAIDYARRSIAALGTDATFAPNRASFISNLSRFLIAAGDPDAALVAAKEVLEISEDILTNTVALLYYGFVAEARQQRETAALLLGFFEEQIQAYAAAAEPEVKAGAALRLQLSKNLAETDLTRFSHQGGSMTQMQALELGRSIERSSQ